MSSADELQWSDIFRLLLQARRLVGSIAIGALVVGFIYFQLAPRYFRSEISLIAVERQAMNPFLSQLGSLATIAGTGFGEGGHAAESIAVLKSRDLVREYIVRNDLLPILYKKNWDASAGRWNESKGAPDLGDAVDYFSRRIITINDDRKAGLIKLSVTWTDPLLAQKWSEGMVQLANERLKGRALGEAQASIRALRQSLSTTDVPAVQQALGRLLEAELQKELVAQGQEEFAFKVVDSAEVPRRYVSPRPLLIGIAALMVTAILSVALVLLRAAVARK